MGKSKKARSGKIYQFHLDFKEVNGNVKKLVVGSCRMTKLAGRFNSKTKSPNFVAKAIDTDFSRTAHDNTYDARMDAMDQLFHKIRNGDKVEVITSDPVLIDIAAGNTPKNGADAKARFNAYAETAEIRVKHASEHGDPESMATAEHIAKLKVSSLQSSQNDAKGYHR